MKNGRNIELSNRMETIQLLNNPIRTRIEEVISAYRKREWKIRSTTDMTEFACHHCAILSDDSFAVFAKYSEAKDASKQFEIEIAGLKYLSKNAGVSIPEPIDIIQVESGTLFIMKALKAIKRSPLAWRQIGKTLARIHKIKSDSFGFPKNGFAGPLFQDNTLTKDWSTFYRERRLCPRLKIATNSGNLPSSIASQVEKLIQRVPELCNSDITPTLLHGDAQQNNFISTEEGTFAIDPAVYFGNSEIDLALIDCWQTVPDDVLEGYNEELPIDPDFGERRNLWRISMYLAAVAIEGPLHLNRLKNALQGYL